MYVWVEPEHTPLRGPEIAVGTEVAEDNDRVLAALVPKQLEAVTERFPEEKPVLNETVTFVVPWPETIEALAGAVQLYKVAFATAAVEKDLVAVEQAPAEIPEILTG